LNELFSFIRKGNSNDIFVVARAVLDSALPTRDAPIDILNEKPPHAHHQHRAAKATAPADAEPVLAA
jgi:hypothetical protein